MGILEALLPGADQQTQPVSTIRNHRKILESFEIIKHSALSKESDNEQLKEDLEVVEKTLRELKGN